MLTHLKTHLDSYTAELHCPMWLWNEDTPPSSSIATAFRQLALSELRSESHRGSDVSTSPSTTSAHSTNARRSRNASGQSSSDDIQLQPVSEAGGQILMMMLGEYWAAVLRIGVKDVATLMKDGLFWSEENLDREAGYVVNPQHAVGPSIPKDWKYARFFSFEDIGIEPRWKAKMHVFSRNLEQLSRFEFGELRVDKIVFCRANDAEGNMVYLYDDGIDGKRVRINSFFDKMPLEGWWPWPRRNNHGNPTVDKRCV